MPSALIRFSLLCAVLCSSKFSTCCPVLNQYKMVRTTTSILLMAAMFCSTYAAVRQRE